MNARDIIKLAAQLLCLRRIKEKDNNINEYPKR